MMKSVSVLIFILLITTNHLLSQSDYCIEATRLTHYGLNIFEKRYDELGIDYHSLHVLELVNMGDSIRIKGEIKFRGSTENSILLYSSVPRRRNLRERLGQRELIETRRYLGQVNSSGLVEITIALNEGIIIDDIYCNTARFFKIFACDNDTRM